MLSGPLRRRAAARESAPAPAFASTARGVAFSLAGMDVEALAAGALYLPEAGTLIVSDVHFEKGSSFAMRGQMLPPYDTSAALGALEALAETLRPRMIVSLGDSFHDAAGPLRMGEEDRARLARLVGAADWVWIEGNHDPVLPAWLGGRAAATLTIGTLTLRHEPVEGESRGEIAGHLHPCAKITARGRSVRARCFATDGVRLIMPAFGAFTGGLNLRDSAFEPVFPRGAAALMLGFGKVYPAPAGRLIPDG